VFLNASFNEDVARQPY